MRIKLIGFVVGALIGCSANAATWYGVLSVHSPHTLYFFDSESVIKKPGSVTVWLKAVNSLTKPDSDGSYSTATRNIYSCATRTVQMLMAVQYDKNQNHLRTINVASKAGEVVPGSVGEALFKTFCSPGFPTAKSDDYVEVGDNDVYAAAQRVFDSHNDPAPK